jgi:hypothetical protein
MAFKIDNAEVWNEVKNGNLDGLSVEGRVIFKEVEQPITNMNMNKEKNPQTLWDNLKAFFSENYDEKEEDDAQTPAHRPEATG